MVNSTVPAHTEKVKTAKQSKIDHIIKSIGGTGVSKDELMKIAKLPRKKRQAALKDIREAA